MLRNGDCMGYSIGKVAEKYGLSVPTLRYYDKEGLLPFVDRTESGQRCFKESDFELLCEIECLKKTGMSIKDIKQFIDWRMEGEETLENRLSLFQKQKDAVHRQIEEFNQQLEEIEFKIWYYEAMLQEDGEKIKSMKCKEVHDLYMELQGKPKVDCSARIEK